MNVYIAINFTKILRIANIQSRIQRLIVQPRLNNTMNRVFVCIIDIEKLRVVLTRKLKQSRTVENLYALWAKILKLCKA